MGVKILKKGEEKKMAGALGFEPRNHGIKIR